VKLEGTSLIRCRNCRRHVEDTATWCPSCGKPLRRFDGNPPLLILIAIVVFLILLAIIGWSLFLR